MRGKSHKWKYVGTVSAIAMGLGLVSPAGCAPSHGASDADSRRIHAGPPDDIAANERPSVPQGPDIMTPAGPDPVRVTQTAPSQKPSADGHPARDKAESNQAEARIAREELHAWMKAGPGYIFRDIRVEPSRAKGRFEGFKIQSLSPQAHRFLGSKLREGDVVTHINGVALRTPEDFHEAWKLAGQAEAIRVDFRRESQPSFVHWRVE